MKNTIAAIAISAVFAACSSKKAPDTTLISPSADTSVLKDSSFTDRGQTINMQGVSDTIVTPQRRYVKVDTEKVAATEVTPVKPIRHHTRRHSTGNSSTASVYNGSDASTSNTQVAEKKKGWSNAAKGAVIGAGTGAIAGAIVSKKKGTGAIVGGLLGAGGGYLIGKSKDKKAQQKQ